MINPPALIVPAGSRFPLGFQLWKMLLFRRPPTHVAPRRERGTAQGKPCGQERDLARGLSWWGPSVPVLGVLCLQLAVEPWGALPQWPQPQNSGTRASAGGR